MADAGRMLITVDASLAGADLDLEVSDASLAQILAFVGASPRPVWCGTERLDPDHPAGRAPLIHGARLTDAATEPSTMPSGPFLAAVAGPDAGCVMPLDHERTWGRDADVSLEDPALSRRHARIGPWAEGAWLADAGSTNGIRVFGGTRRRGRWLVPVGGAARLGDTVLAVRGVRAESDDGASGGARDLRSRVAAMSGTALSAVVLAAVTGRWYLALAGLVLPAVMLAPLIAQRLRPGGDASLEALPEVAPTTARATSEETPEDDEPWAGPVAVTGARQAAEGLARAVILARGRRPPAHELGLDETWLAWLAPPLPGDGPVIVAEAAPSWCDVVCEAHPDRTVTRRRSRAPLTGPVLRVSQRRADHAARRRAGAEQGHGLPSSIRWADVAGPLATPATTAAVPRDVAVTLGVTHALAGGGTTPWRLDLDADGPHLLVAGTTGSGKSAFLELLVLSLCERLSPHDLEVALFDFKGGAGLASCATLPHVVGIVSDLDASQARRALSSLAGAVAERKAALAEAGLPSFAAWEARGDAPPRLLVVVDEFQEVSSQLREFVPDLTRIAAQGRSLGMHVVLATQRPAGAVTPEIRANTNTTIAFRVASDAESRDLVGTSEASQIPAGTPGRGIVCRGHERREVQGALPLATPTPAVRLAGSTLDDDPVTLAAHVAQRWRVAAPARPLWQPPLPDELLLDELDACVPMRETGPGIVLGIVDSPRERSREALSWDPRLGPLVAVGSTAQARRELLSAAVAGAAGAGLVPVWLPADAREAARTLWLARERADVLIAIEDLGAAAAMLADVDRGAAVELITSRAAAGLPLAAALGAGTHHRLASHASVRLVGAGLSDTDAALWSVPRDAGALPTSRSAAWAWTAEGWREARIAIADAPAGARLVEPLPNAAQASAATRDRAVIGIGGDEAVPVTVRDGEPWCVVGLPGRTRDGVVALLEDAGAMVATADSSLLLPPTARDGALLVLEPTPRQVEDLCKASGLGLVDPVPVPGRTLCVREGAGMAVQLVETPVTAVGDALPALSARSES